jgi:F-type H+-transporting ATPase subunit a
VTTDPGAVPAPTEDQNGPASGALPGAAPVPPKKRARGIPFKFLIPATLVAIVVALMVSPPFPKGGTAGQECGFPQCFITSAIEFPPPNVVIDLSPKDAPAVAPMVYFHPSISNTILTMWIVMALLLLVGFLGTRRMKIVPGRVQNLLEWAYEFGSDFAAGIGGPGARRYFPVFGAFFLFILFANWSGLVPPVGKIDQLRAPTSDVNITIGLALTSFILFEGEGFHRLGVRGYLSKFFPIGEFRKGIGPGLLAMYVGFIELFLEFVKPVTLSMRLFGNIYGGEVALAVISALTLAIIPVTLVGLEALLNLIQALIFSVLTLMFILIAIEGHEAEEHHPAAEHADSPQPVAA